MLEFWADYGLALWGLTTALAVIALVWLGWIQFAGLSEGDAAAALAEDLAELKGQLDELAESAPLMKASLGRALQHVGVVRYNDPAGAQSFSLVVANARGEGFVLSSSVRGGLLTKPLVGWTSQVALTPEEQAAVREARLPIDPIT